MAASGGGEGAATAAPEHATPVTDAAAATVTPTTGESSIVVYTLNNPFADALRLPVRDIPLRGTSFRLQQHYRPDGKGGTSIGFGASVYNGAIVLADYVAREEVAAAYGMAGGCVVELGTGLGLVAMALARCTRARRVIATDGDAGVVAYAAEALAANGIAPTVATTARLLWGDAGDEAAVAAAVAAAQATGGGDGDGGMARRRCLPDAVVAADVVAAPYADHLPALVRTLQWLMGGACTCPPPTRCPPPSFLLAYQRRHGVERAWFRAMEAWCTVTRLPPTDLHPDFQDAFPPLAIYVFTPTP